MVACDETHLMWGQEIYGYRDVLASAEANVGDTIRFGVHVNTRGQPQVSLPVWKIGEDGLPIGLEEGTVVFNAEELAAEDPSFLERLKEEIEGRSEQQNHKRSRLAGDGGANWTALGGGKGGPPAKRAKGGGTPDAGAWGGAWGGGWGGGGEEYQWAAAAAKGGKGWGGAWGGEEVTLFVSGLPPGVERREVLNIFRQYAGFSSLRLVSREDHSIGFVSFATTAQAQFVADALTGYVFDQEVPPEMQTQLSVAPAKEKLKGR